MSSSVNAKILLVDDDSNLLEAIIRQYHSKFDITVAQGGTEGLAKVTSDGPFAVIVSDMRMPDMNGIQFLSQAREIDSDAVRIMLTGNADLETAMHAVNEGNIFRFLMKPCRKEILEWALESALEQFRLVTAERELLEKTLKRSIQVLTDILSLVNPTAFSRASRLREYVGHVARKLNLNDTWQFELAALLSQIGCVAVPPDILATVYSNGDLSTDEEEIYQNHPEIGAKLVSQIPRLEHVGEMIAQQNSAAADLDALKESLGGDRILFGAHLLKICNAFDALIFQGKSRRDAINDLRAKSQEYSPNLIKTLETIELAKVDTEERDILIKDLNDTMTLAKDVVTRGGLLVAPAGQKVTLSMRTLIMNYAQRNELEKRVMVLIPSTSSISTPVGV